MLLPGFRGACYSRPGNPDGHPYRDGDCGDCQYPIAYALRSRAWHGHPGRDPTTDTHSVVPTDPHPDPHADKYTDDHPNPHAYPHRDSNAGTIRHGHRYAHPHPDLDGDARAYGDLDPHGNGDT